tara:strand:+ start:5757 stop:6713 length:957 start_codon:yes stop_codon:yes gene_type:complete
MYDNLSCWKRARHAGVNQTSHVTVVDIGGTSIKIGGIREGATVDFKTKVYIDEIRADGFIEGLAKLISDYSREHLGTLDGVVITIPGLIDRDHDRILKCKNISELEGRKFASELHAILNVPVVLERDVILLLKGEYFQGAAKYQNDVAGLFIGTGIGASYLNSGQPFRGGGWALEIGHIPIFPILKGKKLNQAETLEDLCSGSQLVKIANKYEVEIGKLFTQINCSNDLTNDLDYLIDFHAFAVSVIISTFSPKLLVIGGGVTEMEGYPFDRLRDLATSLSISIHEKPITTIMPATLRWESVLYGTLSFLHDLDCAST